MVRYKVEYANSKGFKTQIIIQDRQGLKGRKLNYFLAGMIKHQKGFRKPEVVKGDIEFRKKLLKNEEV